MTATAGRSPDRASGHRPVRGRAKPPAAPLPQRDGIDPVRLRLPTGVGRAS
ncbi:hypothetical protein OG596_08345 [Streptomyces sp. NBC_01102]|uniref:hypothetical protein n=1 Tax=unclassified Streptomyces TaxID=2593676 RepID=UPI00387036F2|nr:hypothetical protein OG596_08345 [Streptomyces sp. NBC_01102]